jgi:hypothetical protein
LGTVRKSARYIPLAGTLPIRLLRLAAAILERWSKAGIFDAWMIVRDISFAQQPTMLAHILGKLQAHP